METSLHRQLKALYCADDAAQEVTLQGYRIDAVADGRLIEIQYGSLGQIRNKVQALLKTHEVLVVKPLAASKLLIKRNRRNGRVLSTRYSPTHETLYHIFDDLVHFTEAYGHPRLTLEILLTEQEEHRLAVRKVRKFGKDFRVADRLLRAVCARHQLRSLRDLVALLPAGLPETFSTQDVARLAEIPRWLAQKMAYCLRQTGAVETVAKKGNNLIYRVSAACRPAA